MQSLVEVLDGEIVLFPPDVELPPGRVAIGIVEVKLDGLVVVVKCVLEIANVRAGNGPDGIAAPQHHRPQLFQLDIGRGFDGVRRVLNRMHIVALEIAGACTRPVIGGGAIRVEPDRLRQVGDRVVEIALSEIILSPVAVSLGIVRLQADDLIGIRDCLVDLAC